MVNLAAFYDGPEDKQVRQAWVADFAAALQSGIQIPSPPPLIPAGQSVTESESEALTSSRLSIGKLVPGRRR